MQKSLVSLALLGLVVPAAHAGALTWSTDYDSAKQQGKEEQKPLVVVIGSGEEGWVQISKEGKLDKKIKTLLSERYVCVYVDTEQIEGQHLAREFEIPEGLGIVISDSAGKLQAFRHGGDLSNEKLAEYLRRYSDPDRVVRVTESNPGEEERAAPVQPVSTGRPGIQGLIAPAPAFFPSFAGGGGRGC